MSNISNRGFSLIEMLIVITIIGILASVAYGSYQNSVQKSRRADGKDALARAAASQEKHYLKNNQYSNDMDDIGGNASVEGNYSLSSAFSIAGTDCSDAADRQCFTLTATARGAQADDTTCATMTLDSLGRKAAADSSSNDTTDVCW